jgi:single-strand binding protein
MINRVVLVGRLTKDPELRYTPNGVAACTFTLAVNRPFTNQQGDRDADFINCVAWRGTAENLANYQKKGNLIGIDGRIQTRSYEGNDGKRRYIAEVIAESVQFLEPKKDETTKQQSQQKPQMTGGPDSFFDDSEPINIDDLDLPF